MNHLENDFRPEARSLLQFLALAGIAIIAANNGGDEDFRPGEPGMNTEAQFLEELCAADEARLYVRLPGSHTIRFLYLVFGNSPGELVADYSAQPALEAVCTMHSNAWEGTEQITILRAS